MLNTYKINAANLHRIDVDEIREKFSDDYIVEVLEDELDDEYGHLTIRTKFPLQRIIDRLKMIGENRFIVQSGEEITVVTIYNGFIE